jgi:ATP-dependent Clp protease ATP-binding subunit ClpB
MRMDKLTSRFQQALADAQSLALGRDHQVLEPAHVMLALIDSSGGSVRPLLMKAGVDVNKLRAGLLAVLDGLPKVEGTPGEIHISNDLNRVLNVTDKLAQQRGDQFVSSELFILAAFEDRSLARVFKESGAVRGAIEKAIDEVRGGEKVSDPNAEESRLAL